MKKLVVGMTGSTGAIFGVRLLQVLADTDCETHLIISKWAQRTVEHETSMTVADLRALATETYGIADMGAKVSSGSFRTDGMVVVPCSMRTVAAIAHGNGDHLVHRAADVILKERRKLVLVARETPLNDIHLENLLKLSRMGVTILPPMPAFYNQPKSLADMVDHIVMRILDQFDMPRDLMKRWDGKVRSRSQRVRPIK
ncbi:MAG: UbiX family flavin prenyltransferase [Hyphomicrobiales bacterium]|jgi:4-hydroxy-3-polyprenylbenzoate decarboxylase|nr:UbiX family flavin prenyltransferase [Hyphomicrobiales bacterium]